MGHCYGSAMPSVTELVKRYYSTVDAGDAGATSALFAADASYDRPGYPTMVGQQITDFYHGERVIDSGAHSLQEIIVDGDAIAQTPATVKIRPSALKVRVPRTS